MRQTKQNAPASLYVILDEDAVPKIKINSTRGVKFMMCCRGVQTKFVQISFTGSNKPAILMGKSDKDGALVENYRYLLMPMRYAS